MTINLSFPNGFSLCKFNANMFPTWIFGFLSICAIIRGLNSSPERRRIPNLNDFNTVDDFENYAKKYMSKQVFTYIQSGAAKEQTLKENTHAFSRLKLLHKILRDTSQLNITTTILGQNISMPIGFCPLLAQLMETPDGENATAKAALQDNTVFILSARSSLTLEAVAASAPKAKRWFQVFNFKNRNITEDLLKRAKAAGYSAIVLTADEPVMGYTIGQLWGKIDFEGNSDRFGNMKKYEKEFTEEDMEDSPTLIWTDLQWMKSVTGLPLIIKGILTSEEADQAVTNGADAIIVSNHGGRQLDGVPASIDALPDVVKTVNGRVEVYMDGGIRTGSDIAKAIALGAKAVFIGRPVLYGLYARNEKGVRRVTKILTTELKNVMSLMGAANNSELNRSYVKREEYYRRPLDN